MMPYTLQDTALYEMNTHKAHIHGGEVVRGFWVILGNCNMADESDEKSIHMTIVLTIMANKSMW